MGHAILGSWDWTSSPSWHHEISCFHLPDSKPLLDSSCSRKGRSWDWKYRENIRHNLGDSSTDDLLFHILNPQQWQQRWGWNYFSLLGLGPFLMIYLVLSFFQAKVVRNCCCKRKQNKTQHKVPVLFCFWFCFVLSTNINDLKGMVNWRERIRKTKMNSNSRKNNYLLPQLQILLVL